jgi:DNA invertase Pin-like site-specific DNA recombinase
VVLGYRLARNLDDLRRLVRVEFVKEKLVFTGEDSPDGDPAAVFVGAFAEFERALILEHHRSQAARRLHRPQTRAHCRAG